MKLAVDVEERTYTLDELVGETVDPVHLYVVCPPGQTEVLCESEEARRNFHLRRTPEPPKHACVECVAIAVRLLGGPRWGEMP